MAAAAHQPPLISALCSAFDVMDVDGMNAVLLLREALAIADELLTERHLFGSTKVRAAAQRLAAQSWSGYGDAVAALPGLPHTVEMIRAEEMDAAYVIGLAAGLRVAGGAR